jgi:hypothetical protein
MLQDARHGGSEIGVEHDADGDDRKRPADGAARRFQEQHDEDRAHENVHRPRVADPEGEVVEDPGDVEAREGDQRGHDPVGKGHGARAPPAGLRDRRVVDPARREDQEDQAEHEGHVDAAVGALAQEPEAGGVVVEQRQREEQPRHDPPGRRRQRAEAHLRIELLLEALRVGERVEFGEGGGAGPSRGFRKVGRLTLRSPAGRVGRFRA